MGWIEGWDARVEWVSRGLWGGDQGDALLALVLLCRGIRTD